MARDEQELQRRRKRLHLTLLLRAVLSMLYHQNLVRHSALEEENRVGEVWKWDLHLVHLLEVCRVLVNRDNRPDPCYLQVKRLQHEPRVFSVEGPLTFLRGGRKWQEVHNGSAYINTSPCRFRFSAVEVLIPLRDLL
jgi:hypothetical protein